MSLGNTYDNNARGKKEVYDPSVYTPYKMNNAEGKIEQTCLSFSLWNNSLKISIFPRKNTGVDGQVSFDYDNGISIYLNHTKARMLANEIRHFMADPEKFDNSGVPSGQALITVSRGTEFNSPAPLIIIRKIDENGTVMSSFAYETKNNFFFSVRNYTEAGQFQKSYDDYRKLELEEIVTMLEEFYKASTCAVAFTVIDQMKYENTRQKNVLNAIASKLGVETSGGGSRRSYSSSSYFNNASGSGPSNQSGPGYTQTSLDDID